MKGIYDILIKDIYDISRTHVEIIFYINNALAFYSIPCYNVREREFQSRSTLKKLELLKGDKGNVTLPLPTDETATAISIIHDFVPYFNNIMRDRAGQLYFGSTAICVRRNVRASKEHVDRLIQSACPQTLAFFLFICNRLQTVAEDKSRGMPVLVGNKKIECLSKNTLRCDDFLD